MGVLDQGISYIRNNSLYEAEKYFLEKIILEPENDALFRFLGKVYSLQGRRGAATNAIEQSIELNVDQPMWLYMLLAVNKLNYVFVHKDDATLPENVRKVLSSPEEISKVLKLDAETYPLEIFLGDGLLGKKLMFKAMRDKMISFVSPVSGDVVSTDKSISEYAYYFNEDDFILTFFSDWAYPFLFYQIYLIKDDRVLYGYLDDKSKLDRSNGKADSFLMYYANLLRVLRKYKKEISLYLQGESNELFVKNQNFPHLGHAIWNGLSSLSPFINNPDLADKIDRIYCDVSVFSKDVMGMVLGDNNGFTLPESMTIEEVVYDNSAFLVTLKDNYVHPCISIMMVKNSISLLPDVELNSLRKFRTDHFPIVILGLRSGTRMWIDQEEGFLKIIDYLQSRFVNIGFIVDGMNVISSNIHKSHANINLEEEVGIANNLIGNSDNIVSVVGRTVEDSISWCESADLFIAPWGAGLAKYKWLNNKEGVIFCSKCVLEEKADLHIYDSEEFLGYPTEVNWVDSKYSKNYLYDGFDGYSQREEKEVEYFYQNYRCDWEGIVVHALEMLKRMEMQRNFRISNFLKYV